MAPLVRVGMCRACRARAHTHRDQKVFLRRHKGQTITTGYNRVPMEMETLTLTVLGRSNALLQALIAEALEVGCCRAVCCVRLCAQVCTRGTLCCAAIHLCV